MPITSKSKALELVEARFGSLPVDADALLVASAGLTSDDPAKTAFRPYAVLALLFASRFNEFKSVRSAAGSQVEYADPFAAAQAMWDLQNRFDGELDADSIPEAFQPSSCEFESVW